MKPHKRAAAQQARARAAATKRPTVSPADTRPVRGSATYSGDVREDIGRRIVGPTTSGQLLVSRLAIYNADADSTHVRFRTATARDLRRVTA